MPYSREVVRRARQKLEFARGDRESQARQRLQEVYAALPRVREIDIQLRRSMALAAQSVFNGGQDAESTFDTVKQANLSLQQERRQLIDSRFGAGYLDESPICPRCGGTGYIGTTMCVCLQELCRQEQEKDLALLAAPDQAFEFFRLDYYPGQVDSNYGVSPRLLMQKNYQICLDFARNFSKASGNLLFIGGTGLGKTFLSACIAREVARKGSSVTYKTAQDLFAILEKDHFNPDTDSHGPVKDLMECDLLIIDDLGTELPGNFVTTALYSVVNGRLLAGKPMVISTNLTVEEITRRYSPQIGSRLQGDFKRLTFIGQDIRVLKNRGL